MKTYIEELQNIQAQDELSLTNKLSANHIKFHNYKMKVSSSVADAIEFFDLTQNL